MKMTKFYTFLLVVSVNLFHSQSIEPFHFDLPEHLISNGKYNDIEFFDAREDTLNFGLVYSSHYRRKVPLRPSVNFGAQLNWLTHYALDSAHANGLMLFVLRKLQFVELGGEIPKYGYCPIRAEIFEKKNNSYYPLAKLDTFLIAEVNYDKLPVTESLLKQSKAILSSFILSNLIRSSQSVSALSFSQINKLDSIEKANLPLYQTQKLSPGVYLNYSSFKNQVPDFSLVKTSNKYGEINRLHIKTKKGKRYRLYTKEVYAYVINDTAYVSNEYGSYPLQKKDQDFYFIGKGRTMPNSESIALSQALGWTLSGAIGSMFGSESAKVIAIAKYNVKIDHCDGSMIWYSKVK